MEEEDEESATLSPPSLPLVYHHESKRMCLYGIPAETEYSCTPSNAC
jgi:hypothetical protein